MLVLVAALLIPVHFTAPMDTLVVDPTGHVQVSADPVHAYVFHQLDGNGSMTTVCGYADSAASAILVPSPPGTWETVWLAPGADGNAVTIFVSSLDRAGNLSAPSNGHVLGNSAPRMLAVSPAAWTVLEFPLVERRACRRIWRITTDP